jgi:hypothetical protein
MIEQLISYLENWRSLMATSKHLPETPRLKVERMKALDDACGYLKEFIAAEEEWELANAVHNAQSDGVFTGLLAKFDDILERLDKRDEVEVQEERK